MNKEEFIRELGKKLKGLPKDEINNVTSYYLEYFEDAGFQDEDVSKEVGTPAEIASQILADYAFNKGFNKGSQVSKKKSPFATVWFVILAILAAPIGLPLAFAAVMIIFALILVVVMLIFTGVVVLGSFVFTGFILFFAGISVVGQGAYTGILFIGSGFLSIGISMLGILFMKTYIPKVIFGLKNIFKRVLNKINKKGVKEI